MSRRWSVPFAAIALVFGSVLAAAGASAATQAPQATHISAIQPGGTMIRAGGARAQVSGARQTTVTSTNWSGYASNGATGHYTSVSGSWTEPTGICNSKKAQYSSFWVGLDGYSSGSVEQTGTDVDCSHSTPHYYGWYEMYPAFPVNFSNPVHPGDHFNASVTFSGTSTFTLVLSDTTQGWNQTETINQSGLSRSSAECIVEAPSSGTVLPLADFGTLNFTGCVSNGSAIGNQSPIQIIMVDNAGNQKDSISALSSGENFTATWLRAN
jgi:Peptidase A4 family